MKLDYLFDWMQHLCGNPIHCYSGTSPSIRKLPFMGFLTHAHTFYNSPSGKLADII